MAGGKNGVGLYVDADDAIRGRRLDLVTSTPGFQAAVYGAPNGVPATIGGWTKPSSTRRSARTSASPSTRAGAATATTSSGSRSSPEGGQGRIQELGYSSADRLSCRCAGGSSR